MGEYATTPRYRADYHVAQVLYLRHGRELSGPDFAKLWSGTRLIGTHTITGNFWHTGTVPSATRRFVLGDVELIRPLLDRGDMPIFGGGMYVNACVARNEIVDRDFYYAHEDASRSFGYETNPQLSYILSGQWFEAAGPERVLDHFREHFEVADRAGALYGLIDVSAAEDCYGGMVYQTTWVGNAPLHRWVEELKWRCALSKGSDQVRGLYWGNYFGEAILERLGGRDRFLGRFRQQARWPDGRPSARVWEFVNGTFVSLCTDPLGCRPGHPLYGWAAQNLHWLVLELGSHGILNPWAGEPHERSLS